MAGGFVPGREDFGAVMAGKGFLWNTHFLTCKERKGLQKY